MNSTTVLNIRKAWRKYTIKFLEQIYSKIKNKPHYYWDISNGQKTPHMIDHSKILAAQEKAILNFQGWLKIIMAREEGKLPAWEGIRIVREQKLL